MGYSVGDRVYWRSMYGNLCSGTVQAKDHLATGIKLLGMEIPATKYPYLILPDGCDYAIGMTGPFLTLPNEVPNGTI